MAGWLEGGERMAGWLDGRMAGGWASAFRVGVGGPSSAVASGCRNTHISTYHVCR